MRCQKYFRYYKAWITTTLLHRIQASWKWWIEKEKRERRTIYNGQRIFVEGLDEISTMLPIYYRLQFLHEDIGQRKENDGFNLDMNIRQIRHLRLNQMPWNMLWESYSKIIFSLFAGKTNVYCIDQQKHWTFNWAENQSFTWRPGFAAGQTEALRIRFCMFPNFQLVQNSLFCTLPKGLYERM